MYSVEESLGFLLGKISQSMSELFQKHLDVIGINPKQYGILLVVSSNLEETQRSVAKKLKLDRTTIGQQIDILEKKKFLVRIQSKKDKRAYNLKLTSEGETIVKSLWDKMHAVELQVLGELTLEQQKKFTELTKTIYQSEVKIDE